jgi:uncharacterized protein YcbX
MASIASLHIYPVKSCRGIDLAKARLTPTGLEWDRRWMILDDKDRFVTQATNPRLATVTTGIVDGALRLSADGHPVFEVDPQADGPVHRVQVWKDTCSGIDAGDDAAAWLSRTLGDRLRLVRIDERVPRLANPKSVEPEPPPLNFADAYPLLLLSRESLAELNRRLPAPVPMNRFRPNVVVEGVAPQAEDAFAEFRAGSVVLRGVKHCARCVITTTDQHDGSRDPRQEPLRTLKTYRHDRQLRGVTFGQYCVVAKGIGEVLAVGTPLTLDAHQV